jgi:hypothetical protein
MTDLLDVNIKNIKFKKSSEKSKEYKINYILTYNNKKPIIRLENVHIPFGCETYNGKQIINIEINSKKKHYNEYAIINGFENQLANISNYLDKDVIHYIENKESKLGHIIRTHVFFTPEIFCNIGGFKSTMTTNDIKNTMTNVDLELGTFWITDNNYGITWTIKKIEVLRSL